MSKYSPHSRIEVPILLLENCASVTPPHVELFTIFFKPSLNLLFSTYFAYFYDLSIKALTKFENMINSQDILHVAK